MIQLIDTRQIGKTLWISRKLHDAILAKDIVFFEDKLCQGEARWNLFGKGIVCDSEKDAAQLRQDIERLMSA
jgi:hypothetical protein